MKIFLWPGNGIGFSIYINRCFVEIEILDLSNSEISSDPLWLIPLIFPAEILITENPPKLRKVSLKVLDRAGRKGRLEKKDKTFLRILAKNCKTISSIQVSRRELSFCKLLNDTEWQNIIIMSGFHGPIESFSQLEVFQA